VPSRRELGLQSRHADCLDNPRIIETRLTGRWSRSDGSPPPLTSRTSSTPGCFSWAATKRSSCCSTPSTGSTRPDSALARPSRSAHRLGPGFARVALRRLRASPRRHRRDRSGSHRTRPGRTQDAPPVRGVPGPGRRSRHLRPWAVGACRRPRQRPTGGRRPPANRRDPSVSPTGGSSPTGATESASSSEPSPGSVGRRPWAPRQRGDRLDAKNVKPRRRVPSRHHLWGAKDQPGSARSGAVRPFGGNEPSHSLCRFGARSLSPSGRRARHSVPSQGRRALCLSFQASQPVARPSGNGRSDEADRHYALAVSGDPVLRKPST
jgi:hypothetical protein